MKTKYIILMCLCVGMGLVSIASAEMKLVDDFEGYAIGAKPTGVACSGTAGGTLDQESNTTTQVKIDGVNPGNQYYWVQGNSTTSRRGAGFTGVTDSIGNTETGVGFFRFRIESSTTLKVGTFMGMHDLTGTDFLTNSTCISGSINAGFEVYRNSTSGTMDIRTIGGTPATLMTGLVQGNWYDAWIAANNATDTFDLYIKAATAPGDPLGLPSEADKIGTGLAFSKATTNALQGLVMVQPQGSVNGQSATANLDDMYWDGSQGVYNSQAWNPSPASGATLVAVNAVLSWSAPNDPSLDPAFTEYAVYMDPNQTKVDTGIGCKYVRSMDPAASFDPIPDMANLTKYYWRVDTQVKFTGRTDPNTFKGAIWSFTTRALNTVPVANAGASIVTWLDKAKSGLDLAARTTPATETDLENDATITWAVFKSAYGVPDPNASINNPSLLNPIVTINGTGTHYLKLVSQDAENPASVSWMQIDVYADACEAAKHNPNTAYTQLVYDFNNNCIVDMADLAIFAGKWLDDSKLATSNQEFTGSSDVLLWLDASDASTITKDGSNKVTRWNDKNGSGRYLTAGSTGSDPSYLAAALNGKGVVDFGTAVADATGKWLQCRNADGSNFSPANIRTVFWVMKGGNILLGDNTTYDFHRGGNVTDPNALIWSGSFTSNNIKNGKTYLNGTSINGTTTYLPTTYSLVSLVTTNGVQASRLCNDRNLRTGGQQIAEIIVFSRALTDAERQAIEADLKAKWGTP